MHVLIGILFIVSSVINFFASLKYFLDDKLIAMDFLSPSQMGSLLLFMSIVQLTAGVLLFMRKYLDIIMITGIFSLLQEVFTYGAHEFSYFSLYCGLVALLAIIYSASVRDAKQENLFPRKNHPLIWKIGLIPVLLVSVVFAFYFSLPQQRIIGKWQLVEVDKTHVNKSIPVFGNANIEFKKGGVIQVDQKNWLQSWFSIDAIYYDFYDSEHIMLSAAGPGSKGFSAAGNFLDGMLDNSGTYRGNDGSVYIASNSNWLLGAGLKLAGAFLDEMINSGQRELIAKMVLQPREISSDTLVIEVFSIVDDEANESAGLVSLGTMHYQRLEDK